MKTFGSCAIGFFNSLKPDFHLPDEISLLNPFRNPEAKKIIKQFYEKYYNDYEKRIFIFGINPGRKGAGLTGIAFTDPYRLQNDCAIDNSFEKKKELSSTFIYDIVNRLGGPSVFYKSFFYCAVCPVGFVKYGKNINYYDSPELLKSSEKFIIKTLKGQIKLGADRRFAICLGEGKNYKYFNKLNSDYGFFDKIVPLAHPRYIMQYKRKNINFFISEYLTVLNKNVDFQETEG